MVNNGGKKRLYCPVTKLCPLLKTSGPRRGAQPSKENQPYISFPVVKTQKAAGSLSIAKKISSSPSLVTFVKE